MIPAAGTVPPSDAPPGPCQSVSVPSIADADVRADGALRVDVAILTALAVEAAAVVEAIGNCSVHRWQGRSLHLGDVAGQRVLVFPIGGVGNASAAQAAQQVISVWNPARLMLVGIAGGAPSEPDDIRLGDILVPDQVVGYELAKVTPDDTVRRYEVYRPDAELLARAQSLRPADWVDGIRMPRPGDPGGRSHPLVHVGPVLTGDKVLADDATLAGLRLAWPKAIGIEMESLGVALAAYQNGPGFLMVKAVSDFADTAKNDDWHRYAADAAARFAVAVVGGSAAVTAGRLLRSSGAARGLAGAPYADGALRAATVDFGTLIAERTEDFVGRRGLLARLSSTLDDPQFASGYVVIGGEPGIGKTALLATLVRRWELVHHFNSVLTGITSTDKFLRNVCARLILKYRLPYERLPDDAASDSATLLTLLEESARGQRVVVAVDAIDETSGSGTGNRLFFPPALPRSVFFILTLRDPNGIELYVDERRDLFIDERDPESSSDAREYIVAFLTRHPAVMARRLAALDLAEATFVDMLTERSEGNFMYLRHVLRSVRDRSLGGTDPAALTTLPRGLSAYYTHLEQQITRYSATAPERQLAVLAVLATWPEPLSAQRLAFFAGERLDTTRTVLRRWAGFLNPSVVDDETRFALYHASFRDFLADRLDMGDVRTRIEVAIESSMR